MSPRTFWRSILFIGGVAVLVYAIDWHSIVSKVSPLAGYYDVALEKAGILLSRGKRGIDWVLASEYGDRVRLFFYAYLVYAVAALLFPGYPKTFRAFSKMVDKDQLEIAKIFGVLGSVLILCWFTYRGIADSAELSPSRPTWPFHDRWVINGFLMLLLFFPALGGLLVIAGIILSSVVWVPLLLIVLPGILAALCRLVFTLVILAPIKGLIMAWHSLHYLFVPHPAEEVYRAGVEQHLPIAELAANVADAMYTYDLKDIEYLPKACGQRTMQNGFMRSVSAWRLRTGLWRN